MEVQDAASSPRLSKTHEERPGSGSGVMMMEMATLEDDEQISSRGDGEEERVSENDKEKEKKEQYPHGTRLVLIVTALALSVFLSALDITIVATAIPKITNEFNGLDKAAWYGSAFFLTSGSFQASWGKAYRYFDMKWTFVASIAVFELGSLLCGVAPNSDAFIVGRAIAGSGVAGMGTGGYIIVAYVVEPMQRPTYTGIMGLSYCFASVLGPLVGGAITTGTTWRWCFYINLPVGAITVLIIVLFFHTPDAARPTKASWKEKFLQADFVGVALVLGALISYSLATQYGGQSKAWGSGTVIGLLATAAALTVAFALWERRAGERAMVVPRLLAQPHVAVGSAFVFPFAGSYFLAIYYLPVYFQSVDEASPIASGVDTLPLILASTVAVISAGVFITRTGHAVPLRVASAVVATLGSGLLFTLDIGTATGKWIGFQIVAALGWGAGFQIPVIVAQALSDPKDIPSVTAIILFFLNIGGGLLINAAQSAFVNRLLITLPTSAPGVDPHLVVATGALALRTTFPSPSDLAGVLEAYMAGIKTAFAIALAACGVSTLVSVLGSWKRLSPEQQAKGGGGGMA
ncbi:major facilitator superfamily domain-containing protein [Xylariaceae sp. FL0594]|nr:major facilitator superfamily domain-containing protein [Xylariaceae sp. FL0594]